ncbi:hypothetical protein ACGF13_26370 [Kitasatospora sp. NPDC048286]|uniref:hypothetical protein n=1 Tax=Kitasatospora sp. NPDC048286 TaxID=3364047 RepID=UPI0037189EA5
MRRTVRGGYAAAAVVLALGVAACTGQGGGGQAPPATVPAASAAPTAPTAHPVVLPEPAPASKQWIVDELRTMDLSDNPCSAPSLANLVVLDDDDGRDRADVLWPLDDSYLCLASITRVDGALSSEVTGDRVASLTARRQPMMIGDYRRLVLLAFFPGDVGTVELRGDDLHLFGPVHQRLLDLGGGKAVTVVHYGYAKPAPAAGDPQAPQQSPQSVPPAAHTPGSAYLQPQLCPSRIEPCRVAEQG